MFVVLVELRIYLKHYNSTVVFQLDLGLVSKQKFLSPITQSIMVYNTRPICMVNQSISVYCMVWHQ